MDRTRNRTDDAQLSQEDHVSREDTARDWVQTLLLDSGHIISPQLEVFLTFADHNEAGSWVKALRQLVDRLYRLQELETKFDDSLHRRKLESMRELAYGASHEINNPLANISSRAQTLLLDETDPARRRKLATINSQAFRAFEMIADLMLFAKPPDMVCERMNLSEVVVQVIEELRDNASEQGTAISIEGAEDACWLNADPSHLAVALKALCRNSLEAISAGGQLAVSLVKNAEYVELSVTDTGPGIPDEVRNHMFDPFYSGREAGRGLGFGLSKCWRIVELHGGTIGLRGDASRRTCFMIRLPLANGKALVA
jgi:signal transduction histidine kinase